MVSGGSAPAPPLPVGLQASPRLLFLIAVGKIYSLIKPFPWTYLIFKFGKHSFILFGKSVFGLSDVRAFKSQLFNFFYRLKYRRNNNKGVLGRPWTKRRVLSAISSTLKFQFTGNHENWRFYYSVRQKIGPVAHKNGHQFSAHFCLVKTPSIATWGQEIKFFMKTDFFPVH